MKRHMSFGAVALLASLNLSCNSILDLVMPTNVTVSLINAAGSEVEATIFISDEQDLPEFLLTEIGDELNFTVAAGETVTFARSCDDLQALVVENANLDVGLGLGPDANTDVLRDGDDFSCGARIVLTFVQSIILDFDITVSVR